MPSLTRELQAMNDKIRWLEWKVTKLQRHIRRQQEKIDEALDQTKEEMPTYEDMHRVVREHIEFKFRYVLDRLKDIENKLPKDEEHDTSDADEEEERRRAPPRRRQTARKVVGQPLPRQLALQLRMKREIEEQRNKHGTSAVQIVTCPREEGE